MSVVTKNNIYFPCYTLGFWDLQRTNSANKLLRVLVGVVRCLLGALILRTKPLNHCARRHVFLWFLSASIHTDSFFSCFVTK